VECADKIWILGQAAAFSLDMRGIGDMKKKVLYTIHPSSRNRAIYKATKETMIEEIRNFLK